MKVVGSGHSFSAMTDAGGALQLSLAGCNRVLHVDRVRSTATVEAGIRLDDLSSRLAEEGLGLSNLGAISSQSLAGAISTGTHGTGLSFGGLCQQIVGLRLVTAGGDVIEASRETNPDVFDAARVGLGCLGVLTSLTLQCEPAFNLRLSETPVSLDHALDRLLKLAANQEHVGLWWVPHTNRVLVRGATRTREPSTLDRGRLGRWLRGVVLGNHAHAAGLWLSGLAPASTPLLARTLARGLYSSARSCAGPSHDVFTLPVLIRQCGLEFALPIEHGAAAIRKLRDLIDNGRHFLHAPVDIRFSAADDAWLSPAYGRPTCYVGIIAYRPFGREIQYRRLFADVDDLLTSLGGRPHWGKLHGWQAASFAAAYPKWAAFTTLRRHLDPNGMFLNEHLRAVLGEEAA